MDPAGAVGEWGRVSEGIFLLIPNTTQDRSPCLFCGEGQIRKIAILEMEPIDLLGQSIMSCFSVFYLMSSLIDH